MQHLLVVYVGDKSATDALRVIAAEGNVHVEVKGKALHVTSAWEVHIVRLWNRLTGDRVQYLGGPCWVRA